MKKILLIFLLLSCSKVIKNMNFKNKDVNEELALAIINNDKCKSLYLMKHGANVNYTYNNRTILELCLDTKNLDLIKALLEKKGKVKNNNIAKIYDIALEYCDYGIIDLIKDKYELKEGSIDSNKYFLLLCYISNAECVKSFIEKNKIEPREVKDKIKRNGLMISASGSKLDISKILIEDYSFDINYKNYYGVTALMTASTENNIDLIKLLIEKGANINDKEVDGWTSLMIASVYGHKEIVELLIEKGANINDKNNENDTALILATDLGYVEIVKLIKRRSNIYREK